MDNGFQGTFYDGQSAAGRPVTVQLGAGGLVISGAGIGPIRWDHNSLRLVSAHRDGGRVSLAPNGKSAERLTLEQDGVLDVLARSAPQLRRAPGRNHRRALLISAAIVAVLAAVYFVYPVLKDGLVAMVPDSWAESWGEAVIAAVPGTGTYCDEPEGVAALAVLTQALTAKADLPYAPKVRVADSSTVNAFAAPGGHVVIFYGLIRDAEGPDEVAGVLAHELGHVKHRHALKRLVDVVGVDVILASIGGNIGSVGGLIMVLRYGRTDEREADRTGVALLQAAGMPTEGLARFFDRVAKDSGPLDQYTQFLSTHPALAERSDTVRSLSGGDAGVVPLTDSQWQALRDICGAEQEDQTE